MAYLIERTTGHFAVLTALGVVWAWVIPDHFTWVAQTTIAGQGLVSILLGIVMLGMGLTLGWEDFARVLKMPKGVAAGLVLQFTIMPLSGLMLAMLFRLEQGLAVGLLLVACCPGGTASNVVAYLARANVALSVTMTLCSTLAGIMLTPFLTGWLADMFIQIDRWALLQQMLAVVLVPVVAGVLLNTFVPDLTRRLAVIAPLVSVAGVVLIVAAIVGSSKELIAAHFGKLLLAVLCLHAAGFVLGLVLPRLMGFGRTDARSISIEVGMQNSGLGASLASAPSFAGQFGNPVQAALAPVPAALSAVCHVVIGSLLAALWRRKAGDTP